MDDIEASFILTVKKLYMDQDQLQPINILALSAGSTLTIDEPELLRPTS